MKLLNIVLVVIFYENDFCDIVKVNEFYQCEYFGSYNKIEFEDIDSIIQGIIGNKCWVSVNFGEVIIQDFVIFEVLVEYINQ